MFLFVKDRMTVLMFFLQSFVQRLDYFFAGVDKMRNLFKTNSFPSVTRKTLAFQNLMGDVSESFPNGLLNFVVHGKNFQNNNFMQKRALTASL